MEATISLIITLAFQDSTSRNITFSGVEAEELGEIKDRILAINQNMPANFAQTFVSNDGAQCTMIGKAELVTVEEEVIYNAG